MDHLTSETDGNELIRRAHAGDQAAFAAFYALYLTPIYRYIFTRVRHKADAEDLAQQVFTKAYEHAGAMAQAGSKPLAYLYTIARNAVIDFWKKRKEVSQSDAEELFEKAPDPRQSPLHQVQTKEEVMKLHAVLEHLTNEQREVITLRYLSDWSTEEIAGQLKKTPEAIRQLQCRALKALRRYI